MTSVPVEQRGKPGKRTSFQRRDPVISLGRTTHCTGGRGFKDKRPKAPRCVFSANVTHSVNAFVLRHALGTRWEIPPASCARAAAERAQPRSHCPPPSFPFPA